MKNILKFNIILFSGLLFLVISCGKSEREIAKAISDARKERQKIKLKDQYIDFSMKDANNNLKKFSELRGEYTLLEFWGSGCKPCRKSNKSLRKIYDKYNSRGFEIVSISVDRSRRSWIKAIKKDKLIWENLSELKGNKSRVAKIYGVQRIPDNFLIAPNGEIIGQNLHANTINLALENLIDGKDSTYHFISIRGKDTLMNISNYVRLPTFKGD